MSLRKVVEVRTKDEEFDGPAFDTLALYWAILTPPAASYYPGQRWTPCYLVGGDTPEAAEENARKKGLLWDWDGRVKCTPTTKPMTETEVRAALRNRKHVAELIIYPPAPMFPAPTATQTGAAS